MLILASNNEHKLREIQAILGDALGEMKTLRQAGLCLHTVEDAGTFEGNALKKAREAMLASGCAALADDSGLEIDALGGEPGILSARYAGEDASDGANNRKMVEKLRELPPPYPARFVCAMALCRPGEESIVVRGACEGEMRLVPAGFDGFGYDPFFVPAGESRTFADLSPEEKNRISHRAAALRLLAERALPHD